MGFGKLLGDFAKGFAQGYIEERGVVGTIQDVAGLGKSILGTPNNNEADNEAYVEAYKQHWNDTTDAIDTCCKNGNFDKAKELLNNFYTQYDEEHDFWYTFWTTRIAYSGWRGAVDYLFAERNRDEQINGKAKRAFANFQYCVNTLQRQASEANEVKEAEEFLQILKDDREMTDYCLSEHKLWNKIDKIGKPDYVSKTSKLDAFKQALKDVDAFYKNGYYLHEGILRVYILLLKTASKDETFLKELDSNTITKIMSNATSAAKSMQNEADSSDADQINKTTILLNQFTQLADTVGQQIRQSIQPAKTSHVETVEADSAKVANNEQEYIDEIKACLADDGEISQRERRLLNRLRESLGISEQRAQELEASLSQDLTDDEKEYVEALKESLADGVISDRERRLLDKLRTFLKISETRAAELEKQLS